MVSVIFLLVPFHLGFAWSTLMFNFDRHLFSGKEDAFSECFLTILNLRLKILDFLKLVEPPLRYFDRFIILFFFGVAIFIINLARNFESKVC